MSDELKSCPFCGGEASWIAARQREDGTYYPAACGCRKCGIWRYGESNYSHGGFATEEDREVSMGQAVSKWNTRTTEQAIDATLGGTSIENAVKRIGRFCVDYVALWERAKAIPALSEEYGDCEWAESEMIRELAYDLATLGGGKLTAEQVRTSIESRFEFDLWVPNARWQAIADELNAELGGTCKLIYDDEGVLSCSRCGRHVSMIIASEDNFCSGCGRRIQKAVKR